MNVINLSYGKDSTASIHVAIDVLGWSVDRIVTADVYATDSIQADLPEMVEFKEHADQIIEQRYGIKVEHFRSPDTFESFFYRTKVSNGGLLNPENEGKIHGWPRLFGSWCVSQLKRRALNEAHRSTEGCEVILGIAADEPARFHNLKDGKKSALVEAGWTEQMCMDWCRDNDLLSPIYTHTQRGGCWFCPKQSNNQLRVLYHNHPELWATMMKWDKDSPCTFKPNGHTVHDYTRRFEMEDAGTIPADNRFKWHMIDVV